MTATATQSDVMLGRFMDLLAKTDLRSAVAVPAVSGAAGVLKGVGLRLTGESETDDLVDSDDQAHNHAIAMAAPVMNVAASTLSWSMPKLKSSLMERSEALREEARSKLDAYEQTDEYGRSAWARARASEALDGNLWEDEPQQAGEIPERISATEMLRRLARSLRVNVKDLVIEGGEVRQFGAGVPGGRSICRLGSPFWTEAERETLVLHHLARSLDIDPDTLLIHDGAVFEQNAEVFIAREVCKVGSLEWNQAHRDLLARDFAMSRGEGLGATQGDEPPGAGAPRMRMN